MERCLSGPSATNGHGLTDDVDSSILGVSALPGGLAINGSPAPIQARRDGSPASNTRTTAPTTSREQRSTPASATAMDTLDRARSKFKPSPHLLEETATATTFRELLSEGEAKTRFTGTHVEERTL